MRRYRPDDLSDESKSALDRLQADVDDCVGRKARYDRATALFSNKNNALFREIKSKLAGAAPSDGACYYCERDRYRDIDHVWPKRHYSEKSFRWDNFVYSCVICNQGEKRDKFAIFIGHTDYVEFDRYLGFDETVPVGDPVLIDIRSENPMEYLRLDFSTGRLVPIGDERGQVRGRYTRDLFKLDADALARARRRGFDQLIVYLKDLRAARFSENTSQEARIVDEIRNLPFPTVIAELRRQKADHVGLDELVELLPADIGVQ